MTVSEIQTSLIVDESSDTRFGSTPQIPFDASRRSSTCQRATDALKFNSRRIADLAQRDDVPRELPKSSHLPHDWALKDLPTCWNDCASPAVCVQTGSCRCVESDCPLRRENPLLTLKRDYIYHDPAKSPLGTYAAPTTILATTVDHKDLFDVLLPHAKAYIDKHPDFLKVHVADGYEGQEAIENSECHKLQDRHCFSADNIMYRAMRHIQVPAEQAELIVLPVYQQCKGAPFMLHDVTHHAETLVPEILAGKKRMATVMTHDWGICIAFSWWVSFA